MTKSVLLTRPAGFNESLAERLNRKGFISIQRPLLEIQPVQVDESTRQRALALDQYDDIVFVSRNAVRYGLPLLETYWPQWPGLQWYAVGAATAAALDTFSIKANCPKVTGSEGLLDLPGLQQMDGRKVLIVRGLRGRQLLAQALTERGASIDYLAVYQSKNIDYAATLEEDFAIHHIDLCVITSGQSCQHLLDSINIAELDRLHIIVPSQRVANIAHSEGCQHVHVAAGADDDALLQAIVEIRFKQAQL